MKIKHLKIYFFIFSLTILLGCIDTYDIDFNQKNNVLVVEGFLTDDYQNPDTIKIQYSRYVERSTFISPIASVKASIMALGTGKEITLVEQKLGGFLPPTDFRINPSEKYSLHFALPNGEQYESAPEQIYTTPPILKVYDKFNAQSRLSDDGKKFLASNDIFLDFKDTPKQKDYYLWRYTHYERIVHCTTCYNSAYDLNTLGCTIKLASFNRTPYYDYQCAGECYAIIKGKPINIMSDVVSDGDLVTGRLIAKIPYHYLYGCLVEIQQMSISPQNYTFYRNLELQSQSTGGLADTPAAAIVGNINNVTNSSDKVVGYFGVVSIQKKRYWVDRKESNGEFDYILSHPPVEEPADPRDTSRPPMIKCVKSATRTPFKPADWQ
ncbi:MAG: DUF4249 domain-containing protein [Arcicella sp.]|nr:DUF4249 domain-containing protein [Arcicella sp.]